jgi:hypothetical protein
LSSQSQPDPAWFPTPETAVFSGGSLEQAVDAARVAFGPGAQIRAARRVRQGLRGRVRFEVLAAPAPVSAAEPSPEPSPRLADETVAADAADALDLTLAELLAAADESDSQHTYDPRQDLANASTEDFTALVRAALGRVSLEAEVPAGTGPHPDPELLDAVAGLLPRQRPAQIGMAAPVLDADPIDDLDDPGDLGDLDDLAVAPPALPATELPQLPAAPAPAARGRQRVPAERGSWSLLALARAGVPSEVLDRVPPQDPEDDLAWLSALRDAIEAVVPAPGELGAPATAVVDGIGAAGAAQILRAGVAGIVPGTLLMDGRALPATAAELALAVRSCVLC